MTSRLLSVQLTRLLLREILKFSLYSNRGENGL